jgi:hypothetical protein
MAVKPWQIKNPSFRKSRMQSLKGFTCSGILSEEADNRKRIWFRSLDLSLPFFASRFRSSFACSFI